MWTQLGAVGPMQRDGAAMAYDRQRRRIVLFGGTSNATYFADTWEWGHGEPSFTFQPASQMLTTSAPMTMGVQVQGPGLFAYQWRRDEMPLTNTGPVSGATTTTLHIDPVEPEHTGSYDIVVTGPCGQVSSAPVNLLVTTCYPDCDLSGTLSIADFACFQTRFAFGEIYADCTWNGTRTIADFGCFQSRFAAGCP